jgi:uncharacterized protein YodC (DUF2158 family)
VDARPTRAKVFVMRLGIGAVVVLKSGGDNMLVTDILEEQVTCVWVSGRKLIDEYVFHSSLLTVVRAADMKRR